MVKDIKQRIFTFLGALGVLAGAYYGYNVTSARQDALLSGELITAPISRITSKRTISTIWVEINGKDFNAGETFGGYDTMRLHDLVKVYHKPENEYVVLYGKKSFRKMLILEYLMFAVGGALILVAFFYKSK